MTIADQSISRVSHCHLQTSFSLWIGAYLSEQHVSFSADRQKKGHFHPMHSKCSNFCPILQSNLVYGTVIGALSEIYQHLSMHNVVCFPRYAQLP